MYCVLINFSLFLSINGHFLTIYHSNRVYNMVDVKFRTRPFGRQISGYHPQLKNSRYALVPANYNDIISFTDLETDIKTPIYFYNRCIARGGQDDPRALSFRGSRNIPRHQFKTGFKKSLAFWSTKKSFRKRNLAMTAFKRRKE